MRAVAHLSHVPRGPQAQPAAPCLVIIGCGNLNRSDDGAGVMVVQRLRREFGAAPPPGVKLLDAGTGGMEVMFQARGATTLVIVDAAQSGSEPGAIFCLPGTEIVNVHQPAYSLHDFRWDHALHAGRQIFAADFPSDVAVYLIEAASLQLGTELTPPVARAVDAVAKLLAQRIGDWCRVAAL